HRRQLLQARGCRRRESDAGCRHHCAALRATAEHRGGEQNPYLSGANVALHRYSLSLGQSPSATANAAATDNAAAPTVAPDSTRRALRMSLRNWLRLSSMPLVSAVSSLSNAGVESSSPVPSATWVAA